MAGAAHHIKLVIYGDFTNANAASRYFKKSQETNFELDNGSRGISPAKVRNEEL